MRRKIVVSNFTTLLKFHGTAISYAVRIDDCVVGEIDTKSKFENDSNDFSSLCEKYI